MVCLRKRIKLLRLFMHPERKKKKKKGNIRKYSKKKSEPKLPCHVSRPPVEIGYSLVAFKSFYKVILW